MTDSKLRLTIVMPSAHSHGGAEEALVQFLRYMQAAETAVQVIFLEDGELCAKLESIVQQIEIVHAKRTRHLYNWWSCVKRIKTMLTDFNASLVLGWMTKGHVYGGLAAYQCGVRAAWFQMGLPESGVIDRIANLIPTSAIFTCSTFAAKRQRSASPSRHVIAVPLGADTERFCLQALSEKKKAREILGLPLGAKIVGIVGRLQSWKGMHTLIRSIPQIRSLYADVYCLIVGGEHAAEPGYKDSLARLIEELQLTDCVLLAGRQVNTELWLQSMDVFVHASLHEPFGIVVVEALALGKPVVACTPGGPDEIIKDLAGCSSVPFEANEELANAIIEIFRSNTGLSPSEIDARIERAESFSASAFASRLLMHLRNLADGTLD